MDRRWRMIVDTSNGFASLEVKARDKKDAIHKFHELIETEVFKKKNGLLYDFKENTIKEVFEYGDLIEFEDIKGNKVRYICIGNFTDDYIKCLRVGSDDTTISFRFHEDCRGLDMNVAEQMDYIKYLLDTYVEPI